MYTCRFLFFFLILFEACLLIGQTRTISGFISSGSSGEKLIGASVYDLRSGLGTVTNNYGFFSLRLPLDSVRLRFSYVGYASTFHSFINNKDSVINIEMGNVALEVVKVEAERIERIEQSTQMSTINMPVEQIKALPSLLGEVDVLKAIQLLPGVQSGSEASSGLYVRGGGPDQNLILLDGTPVYNASHLFGFFSVFNADAINNVKLIKGGFPARYGGRLSSVLDISLKEGNLKEFQGEGSIGIIASRLTLEGPIFKDKTSFIISARRTYIDALMQPFIRAATSEDAKTVMGYYFYDLNAKVNHKFSEKDHLYLSLYTGDDKFYYKVKPYSYLYDGVLYEDRMDADLAWGNITGALRWNHQFSNKLFSNMTATYSHYDFHISDYRESIVTDQGQINSEIFGIKYLSGIDDWTGKMDFDYLPDPDHYIKFGAHYIFHTFRPGATSYKFQQTGGLNIDSTSGADDVYAHETALYIEDDYKISDLLKANVGLHYSSFIVNNKFYHSIQPRTSLRYLFWNDWALKTSYAKMQQYIHLLTNSSIGLPTDLWVPSTEHVVPQISDQVALGIAKTLNNRYLFSIEGYYKWMKNIIAYKDGASFMGSETKWYEKVESGKGWSYGAELFIHKKTGITQGWLGYTLSLTERQFENINFGERFPYKFDRR
ncbi:MAG TPA: TonB-dependent receptor, partial [Bacteroidetes bacterium]|nr:TonB-dependent receptor [Bacteroidota bacterium]